MRFDAMVVGGVVLIVAFVALVVVWIQRSDLSDSEMVAPVVPSPIPVAAAAPLAPRATGEVVVYFDFDSAELPAAESAKLAAMLDGGFKRIDAVGHADRIGPADYNLRLSQRRAAAVREYLVRNKVDPALVHASAEGEAAPASGDACFDMGREARTNGGLVACLQPDRRVEVKFARSQ